MTTASLLPEDYLAQKAERRTNLLCLLLFVIVMAGRVPGAFLVHQPAAEDDGQDRPGARSTSKYQEAAEQIMGARRARGAEGPRCSRRPSSGRGARRARAAIGAARRADQPHAAERLSLHRGQPLEVGEAEAECVRKPSEKVEGKSARDASRRARERARDARAGVEGDAQEGARPRATASRISLVGRRAERPARSRRYLAELNGYDAAANDVTLQYTEREGGREPASCSEFKHPR